MTAIGPIPESLARSEARVAQTAGCVALGFALFVVGTVGAALGYCKISPFVERRWMAPVLLGGGLLVIGGGLSCFGNAHRNRREARDEHQVGLNGLAFDLWVPSPMESQLLQTRARYWDTLRRLFPQIPFPFRATWEAWTQQLQDYAPTLREKPPSQSTSFLLERIENAQRLLPWRDVPEGIELEAYLQQLRAEIQTMQPDPPAPPPPRPAIAGSIHSEADT
jgi:hypothetical protein